MQRCSSDLRLNPHFHSLALDGVFVPSEGGTVAFHALPSLRRRLGELDRDADAQTAMFTA